MEHPDKKIIVYAPNIHSGGGLNLLESFFLNFPEGERLNAILDERYFDEFYKLNVSHIHVIYWVKSNIISWILAEILLKKNSKKDDLVLCFHNIPPIICKTKNIFVYFQNRLIIENEVKEITSFSSKINIFIERAILSLFSKKVKVFFCQTETIRILLRRYLSQNGKAIASTFELAPFTPKIHLISNASSVKKKWGFIYLSSGDPHKNHMNLIKAWKILKDEGIKPSLAITLRKSDIELWSKIELLATNEGLDIQNIGWIEKKLIPSTLLQSNALIFPSLIESFGLPLVEARTLNLPILAPEYDYVRDVCVPTETFDPLSPKSIARAVRRHLKLYESPPIINGPEEFIKLVLGKQ